MGKEAGKGLLALIEEAENLLAKTKEDALAFVERGKPALGVRIRKTMQELKVVAQEIRDHILSSR